MCWLYKLQPFFAPIVGLATTHDENISLFEISDFLSCGSQLHAGFCLILPSSQHLFWGHRFASTFPIFRGTMAADIRCSPWPEAPQQLVELLQPPWLPWPLVFGSQMIKETHVWVVSCHPIYGLKHPETNWTVCSSSNLSNITLWPEKKLFEQCEHHPITLKHQISTSLLIDQPVFQHQQCSNTSNRNSSRQQLFVSTSMSKKRVELSGPEPPEPVELSLVPRRPLQTDQPPGRETPHGTGWFLENSRWLFQPWIFHKKHEFSTMKIYETQKTMELPYIDVTIYHGFSHQHSETLWNWDLFGVKNTSDIVA